MSAAEGRGQCILHAPCRAGLKKRSRLRKKSFGASGSRAHPFCAAEDLVEQLETRESPGLAEAVELARQMTGKSPEVSGWRQNGGQRASCSRS